MTDTLRTMAGTTALVLDSPHSGTDYPGDFGHACDPAVLRRAEDTHVEKLYDFAPSLGAAWIEALFPRSYLDVNRDVTEVDVSLLADAWPGPVASDPTVSRLITVLAADVGPVLAAVNTARAAARSCVGSGRHQRS